jgi:hypothetical protein
LKGKVSKNLQTSLYNHLTKIAKGNFLKRARERKRVEQFEWQATTYVTKEKNSFMYLLAGA